MKIKFIVFLGLMLLLCGCGTKNKYENFEHYDLQDRSIKSYIGYNDNNSIVEYALADITPENHESILTGLFYKVEDGDYILVEKLESSTMDAYQNDGLYQFYENRLYGVGSGDTPMVFMIELNGKDSKINELKLKLEGKVNPFIQPSIISVDHDIITYSGYFYIDGHGEYRNFSCSLENYECWIIED